jgi:hypothetical protein
VAGDKITGRGDDLHPVFYLGIPQCDTRLLIIAKILCQLFGLFYGYFGHKSRIEKRAENVILSNKSST